MTLEVIIFTAAILVGILLYWRESQGNKLYRFINKIAYSKELQMSENDPKGFVYQQRFLLRLVYIVLFYLVTIGLVTFVIPFGLATVQIFAACVVGTVVGTYVASAFFFADEKIDANKSIAVDFVEEKIEQGKEFIEELTEGDPIQEVPKIEEKPEPVKKEKSARDRLKDKGYLK
ncbi:hypothetical protein ABN763_03790 [Spongiivirga sp. MCCC 1A20706]|uniref:hypothetical protein n=1 Tax=Spongiivirga sp. MCCC 1A20706 TaxID=3160963 RepID=UPI003977920B